MMELIEKDTRSYAERTISKGKKRFLDSLDESNYKMIDNGYENLSTKVLVRCAEGHSYNVRPHSFIEGYRCQKCSIVRGAKTKVIKAANKFYELLEGEGYKMLDEEGYTGAINPIHVVCPKGHSTTVTPSNFKNGSRCVYCSSRKRWEPTIKKYSKIFHSTLEDEGYKVVKGIYENETSRITLECPKKHTYDVVARVFLWGHRCPNCNHSMGEKRVERYLLSKRIRYKAQDKFEKCRNKRVLPFDFGVYHSGELTCLIEFEGEQHFRAVEYFGGDESLIYVQNNDSIKRAFCKENNIPLIEIPYWEYDNIEEILDKELRKFL